MAPPEKAVRSLFKRLRIFLQFQLRFAMAATHDNVINFVDTCQNEGEEGRV
jgi:hypothetical protein